MIGFVVAQTLGATPDKTVPQTTSDKANIDQSKPKVEPVKKTEEEKLEPGITSIKAENLIYDKELVVAKKNVILTYGDTSVHSEEMDFDPHTGVLKSVGDVILEREGERMVGKGFVYNVTTRAGTMDDVNGRTKNIYLQNQPIKQELFYKTKQIEINNNILLFKGVDMTTCDFPEGKKHYHITAEQIKVIPEDKMIITHGRIWAGKIALWHVGKMVIDLHPHTHKRQSYTPNVGWNRIDGFFIKTATNYQAYKDNYGTILADFYQKTGFASGIDHDFPLGERGGGRVSIYHQNGSGFQHFTRDQEIADTHYDFGSGLRLAASGNLYRYDIPPITSPDTYNTQASLTKQSQHYSWSLTEQNNATSGFSNSQTVQYHQLQDLGNQLSLDFSENFIKNITGAVDSTTLHNVTSLTQGFGDWSASLAYEKTTSTLASGGFIDRTPELTVKSDHLMFDELNLPYTMSLMYGKYFESFNTLNAQRFDFQMSIPQQTYSLANNLKLTSTSLYRQDVYDTGNFYPTQRIQARYILGNETTLSSTLANHMDVLLDYRSQSDIGFDPLVYDTVSPYRSLAAEVAFYNKDSYKLDIGTSYDYKNSFYQQLVARLDLHPFNRAYFHFDGQFDPNYGQWQNLVTQADIWPFKDIRIQYWSTFSLQNGQVGYQDIVLYKEWHDWEARLVYQWQQQGVFLFVNLKAFPEQQLQLGINPLVNADPSSQFEVGH